MENTPSPKMHIIPAIDLMEGRAVRLVKGDPSRRTDYGDPLKAALRWQAGGARYIHVVDLDGALAGEPKHLSAAARIGRETGLPVQYGGGIRTEGDARRALKAAQRIIIGTAAAALEPWVLELAREFPGRILAAIDLKDGRVATHGWRRAAGDPARLARLLHQGGVGPLLITDTERDGTLSGLDPERVRSCARWGVPFIWAGGITSAADVKKLADAAGPLVLGAVVGKALYEDPARLPELIKAANPPSPRPRIIPCFDLKDGQLVSGVQFENLAPAGDPLALARAYALQGAEEIFVLDISGDDQGRRKSREVVARMLASVPASITVGGGITSAADCRDLFRLGAARVTVNTAAVKRPQLLSELAAAFGSHRIVLSVDARRGEVMTGGGRYASGIDAVQWCTRGLALGAGEILLTSVDRDGTGSGYDLALVAAVKQAARAGAVIASGGGGSPLHLRAALEAGADGVLIASMLHSGWWEFGPLQRAVAPELKEEPPTGTPVERRLTFDEWGLLPAVVVEGSRVLMLGYMNALALRRTTETGDLWFWSRSRRRLWRKGETSGNTRKVLRISADCDGDALLVEVGEGGPICHTGADSCFFRSLGPAADARRESAQTDLKFGAAFQGTGDTHGEGVKAGPLRDNAAAAPRLDASESRAPGNGAPGNGAPEAESPVRSPDAEGGSVLEHLWQTIESRRLNRPADSYVARLMNGGPEQMLRKLGEESLEVIMACLGNSPRDSRDHLVAELADLSFHTLVLMSYYGISPGDVGRELEARRRS